MDFRIEPSTVSDATVAVPGDKSVSHRALMLGSIADGRSEISGFLPGDDCLATLQAMQQMGVDVTQHDATTVTVNGVGAGGLQAPAGDLDLGNSGTAMRLMAGLLAGQAFDSTLTGDASLSARPMGRVLTPLAKMGASIASTDNRPPLAIAGGNVLTGIDYVMPIASAQVKSCVLLAGLHASGRTTVTEPAPTRDHTERMLRTMGVDVRTKNGRIGVQGGQSLSGCPIQVPGDLSSAAFVMLAALLASDADVLIENVGVNPTRTGVITILQAMGGDIAIENRRALGDEPIADIRVKSSQLAGGDVDPQLVSLAIDEFPALFVAAAAARGTTTFSGIGELRVKESDRIAAMSTGLRALGIAVEETADTAIVHGGRFSGGTATSCGDHRIAMSLAVAGSVASNPVVVQGVDTVETSFPGFAGLMGGLGMNISVQSAP